MDFEPFEIDQEIANFLNKYKLWDSLEIKGDISQFQKEDSPKQEYKPQRKLELVKSSYWDDWEEEDDPVARLKPKNEEELKKNL